MRAQPGVSYLRVVLSGEDVDQHPWQCFWLISLHAHRHGIRSSRLTFLYARQDFPMDAWVLTFEVTP